MIFRSSGRIALGLQACLLSVLLLVAGCATEKSNLKLTGDPLVDGPNALTNGPPRDRVLWQYRTAVAAICAGQFALAREMLDDSIRSIQAIYGPDPEARRSRGYFTAEAKKTFLGEPYERCMAYIYRGLLYWGDGELDNARACFRSAEFEDSDLEGKKYTGDWVMCDYLDGLATAKLGGDGSDALKRAQESSKGINLPPYDVSANVLFVLQFGPGPVKTATGKYNEQLKMQARSGPIRSARLQTGTLNLLVAPCDDVGYQATTRGGRVMDHVLANKAVFKSTTSAVGDAALISGGILAAAGSGSHNAAGEVGLGLALFGLASKIVSSATTPQADIRCWESLPEFLSFACASLPPGDHPVTVNFLDAAGNPISKFVRNFTLNISESKPNIVVFISDTCPTAQSL